MKNEINGFEIENYNVHAIAANSTTSICPSCSHKREKNKNQKCLSVFWDTGIGHCNHCGERVQLHTYKKKTGIKTFLYPNPKNNYDELHGSVIDYFKERGISSSTLNQMKITSSSTFMPKAQRKITVIEFNYFLHGQLVNLKSRGKNKDFKFEKGCEIIMYNIDSIINEKTCVLVEGEVDAASYHEAGIKNVCSVPNGFTLPRNDGSSTIKSSYLDSYYEIFDSKEKIILAFDNDLAGNEGAKEFIRRLGVEKCYTVDLKDCKDANEYLISYGKESLAKTIEEAVQIPLEDIIQINDIKSDLLDFWQNGAPRGKTIGLNGFDEIASFETKQYTLILSAPGSGKSEFIDYIISKLAFRYGDKFGICSTENKPLKFHYDKIFKKIYGRRPNSNDFKNKDLEETFDFIQEHFIHVDKNKRYFLEDVLLKFAELVKRKGCRYFVLDPFNKIKLKSVSRSNVNEYTEEYHALLDDFCTTYDAHIFLVLHPNKLSRKKLHGEIYSEKTFVMPTAYDAKGGGEHFDMSYNILGIVRDFERNVIQVRTLKWKFQHLGESGIDVFLNWNINNGRYEHIQGHYDENTKTTPVSIYDNQSWLKTTNQEILKPVYKAKSIEEAFDLDELLIDQDF